MSLSELLVVIIVGALLIKPKDLPKILKKIKQFYSFVHNAKKEILSHIDPDLKIDAIDNIEDIEKINFYLEKIIKLGSQYDGKYSLPAIKKHYNALIKKKIKKAKEIK